MSSGTTTRAQVSAHYDRLKRRVETVIPNDNLLKEPVGVANAVLDMFPIYGAASASAAMPDAEEVEKFMQSLLPSPVEVFTDSFFRAPLFALVSLYKVADLYGCVDPQYPLYGHLDLSDVDRANKNIVAHVWFAHFLGCDGETILACVARYKDSRGTPDSLRRLSTDPSSAKPRHEQAQPSVNTPGNQGNDVQNPSSGSGSINREEAVNAPRLRAETRPASSLEPSDVLESDSNDSRKATNVFQYFKDNKFTGDLSQSIEMTLRDYNVCARQHRLSIRQKADFFINVLSGPARTFFFNNARDDMSFEEMARMMVREYNSDSHQLQVQGMLETLRLDKHKSEHEVSSPSEGLTQIIDLIERLTPQCQPQFRSDANKINYLRKAVMGFSWAMTPIGNIITAKYSFNGFVTALREHLQPESELKMAPVSANTHCTDGGTYHQQYGRRPKFVQKHGMPTHSGSSSRAPAPPGSFAESRRKGTCHRCKKQWTPGHRCQPGSIRSYVRDRFKNGDAAVHIVSDLVLGMEGELVEHPAPSDEEDDERRENDVHFSGAQNELSVFDDMLGADSPARTQFIEQSDKERFTNHLSASFSTNEGTALKHPSDFVPGDDQ